MNTQYGIGRSWMIPVYLSDTALSLETALKLKRWAITHDWYAVRVVQEVEFCLVVDPARLYFVAHVSALPYYNSTHVLGSFVDGLWEYDVVELFVKDDRGEAYQEFNLSPAGAWWTALFTGYRQRAERIVDMCVPEVVSEITETSWLVGMAIKRNDLLVDISFSSNSKAAVYAILGKAQRQYCTLSPGQGAPDFHRLERFSDVNPVTL
jgi:hypothetical protein